jgi:hypothetical protein
MQVFVVFVSPSEYFNLSRTHDRFRPHSHLLDRHPITIKAEKEAITHQFLVHFLSVHLRLTFYCTSGSDVTLPPLGIPFFSSVRKNKLFSKAKNNFLVHIPFVHLLRARFTVVEAPISNKKFRLRRLFLLLSFLVIIKYTK